MESKQKTKEQMAEKEIKKQIEFARKNPVMANKPKEQVLQEIKTEFPSFNYNLAYILGRDFWQFEGCMNDLNIEDEDKIRDLFELYLKLLGLKI